jgi:glycerate kinase
MKIMIAPDSFKGSLSSIEVINFIEKSARKHFDELEIVKVPIADGGEGTVEAILAAVGGELKSVEVKGPLGNKISSSYGIINKTTAIIEMASASGMALVADEDRNPMITTTYGTGELILAGLNRGIRNFIVGIGGSATNDGGVGAMQALGVKFLDCDNKEVGFGGGELSSIVNVSFEALDDRIKECSITVICDVNNPLTGPKGATYIYGPQKGADEKMLVELEKGMDNYKCVLEKNFGIEVDRIKGAGAAGGLGAALTVFLGAELKPGIETILELVQFEHLLEGVDLVITGEGRIDGQSIYGKVPVGISKHCKRKNINVVALVGGMGAEADLVYEFGIDSIFTIVNSPMSVSEAMKNAGKLLEDAADRMFRFIKLGMSIKSRM